MKHGRFLVLVLLGVAVGVIVARLGSETKPSGSARPPSVTVAEPARPVAVRRETVEGRRVKQRDLAASDARYSAFELAKDEELTAREVYEREPRDQVFAPVMEKRVQAALDEALHELGFKDRIRGVRVDCKTLSCYTYIEIEKADGMQVYESLSGVLLGDRQQPGIEASETPDLAKVTIYNLYRPETRDEAYYKRFLEDAMRPGLEAARRRLEESVSRRDRP